MLKRLLFLLLVIASFLPLAHAGDVPPFANGDAVAPADSEEARVWGNGDEFDQMLARSGQLLDDPELTAYVQQVMDKLYPEFKGHIHVHIVKSPELNAFALPNGSIYVNQGLLARFQNESQLATVLAHEGIHFVNRHSRQQMQNLKSTAAFGTIIGALGIPIVSLASNVLATSSIFGYSRELESEADNQGYPRMVAAGYDPREAPKTFAHLIAELKASDVKEPYFFSDHPKLQERYDNFLRLSEKTPVPDPLPVDNYESKVAALRLVNLDGELSMGHYKQIVLILTDAEQVKNYPPYFPYYLGEAYRLRGDKGDDVLMEQAYQQAITAAPDYAPSYRALGMYLLKKGSYQDAAQQFEKYLALTKDAADRKYAETYLSMALSKAQQQ